MCGRDELPDCLGGLIRRVSGRLNSAANPHSVGNEMCDVRDPDEAEAEIEWKADTQKWNTCLMNKPLPTLIRNTLVC